MIGTRGFGLSSRSARCRDADSLVFDSVRPFKSRKHASGMFPLTVSTVLNVLPMQTWSGREDLNLRPPVPHTGALAKLRHVPYFYILE